MNDKAIIPLDVKEKQGQFYYGLASVFGEVDSYGDRMMKGCFEKSLSSTSAFPILAYHDSKQTIGSTYSIKESEKGLEVEFSIFNNKDIKEAIEARALIEEAKKAGLQIGLSIGGQIREYEKRYKENSKALDGWDIKEFKLYEISITPIPACYNARIIKQKGSQKKENLNEKEILLKLNQLINSD